MYRAVSVVALPLASLYLMWRSRRQPAYRQFWDERFAWSSFPLKTGRPRVWIHAVSVGETNAAKPLLEAVLERWPECDVLLTHMTPTGREAGAKLVALAPDRIHQCYLPYDAPYAVEKFFRQTQPTIGIIMETEVWPNLMSEAKRCGVPMVLANARESEKSRAQAEKFLDVMGPAFGSFTAILAQSEEDDAVLRLDAALPGRDERLAATDDPEQQNPFGKAKLLHALAREGGVIGNEGFEHLRRVAAHGHAGEHLPLPDVLQNAVDGGEPGADAVRNADGLHQRKVGGLVHTGHGIAHAEGLGEQAGKDIRLLITRHGDEGVHLADVLLLQEGLVRPVAVQDKRALQEVRQLLAALFVDVDELGVHAPTMQAVPRLPRVRFRARKRARWLVGL